MNLEWQQILTHLLGFAIAVWLLKRYAWGPLLSIMEERRNKIVDEFKHIEDEKESVINHGFEDGFVVVDRVAPVFSLKHGGFETLIYNDGYEPVDPGPEAPRARPKKRGFFGRVFGGDEGEAG